MFKSMHIFFNVIFCLGKTLKIVQNATHSIYCCHIIYILIFIHYNLTAGRLNSQKFVNTEVPQKYWNDAVTVIKTHNGGNRSNNIGI